MTRNLVDEDALEEKAPQGLVRIKRWLYPRTEETNSSIQMKFNPDRKIYGEKKEKQRNCKDDSSRMVLAMHTRSQVGAGE